MRFGFILLFFLAILPPAAAQTSAGGDSNAPAGARAPANHAPQRDFPDVYIVTMGPGDPVFSRFGHNAIRISDPASGRDVTYNFGTFDSDDTEVARKFLQRELQYQLSACPWLALLRRYMKADQTIVLQHLDLPRAATIALCQSLQKNLRPENAGYLYDYFRDNCSTRVRDAIDKVLDGTLSRQFASQPSAATYRQDTADILGDSPYLNWIISFVLNHRIDVPLSRWQRMFLPRELLQGLREVTITHPDGSRRPLVDHEQVMYTRAAPEALRREPWLIWVAMALLGGPFVVSLTKREEARARRWVGLGLVAWGLVAGVAGCALTFTSTRPHPDAALSGNLLYFNPLLLVLAASGFQLARGNFEERGTNRAMWISIARWILLTALVAALAGLSAHALGWARQANTHFAVYVLAISTLGWTALNRWTKAFQPGAA